MATNAYTTIMMFHHTINRIRTARLIGTLLVLMNVYLVITGPSILAQTMCAPNSLPRTCSGSQVCTIGGNCGLLQTMFCCITSSGFPTNTPTPLVTQFPTPTNLPTFPPPTSTPVPTPTIYTGSLTPWYVHNLSESKEIITKVISDTTNTHLYIVGRSHIGENGGGWEEGSLGFVKKIRKSDKATVWTKTIGQYLGYYVGAIHDVKEDGSGLYVSGYVEWGSKLYVAKLNPSDGTPIWESTDVIGPTTSWNKNRGLGLEIDSDSVYVVGSDTQVSGQTTLERLHVVKKSKTNGLTQATRVADLTGGFDIARDLVLSGAYAVVVGDRNGTWYYEKLNKSNLSVASSTTSISGLVSTDSVVADSTFFYVSGHQSTPAGTGRVRVEKRRISNLNSAWSYTEPDQGTFQSNAHPLINGSTLVVAANNNWDNTGGTWRDVKVLFLNVSNGNVTKNVTYTGVGMAGGVGADSSAQMFLAGSLMGYTDGALFLLNEVNYTPTPTPTTLLFPGCTAVSWSAPYNVSVSANSFTGTTYPAWNFENGANANFSAAQGATIGGYTEIPQLNPNYGAMWGISATTSYGGWIDYSWYAPYYSGNDIYIMLPGRSAISMGVANPGDRFGVQYSTNGVAFTRLLAGETMWQTMYTTADLTQEILTGSTHFRARVAGFSQIYSAFAGGSCQMVTIPSPTPIPTGPVGGTLTPWYSVNISSFPEYATQVVSDESDEHVYLVGKSNIGGPWGWFQSGNGVIQKIRKSDRQLVWQQSVESNFWIFGSSGLYDILVDGPDVYVSGYTWWGTRLYVGKYNALTGSKVWSTEDNLGWTWFPYAGQSLDADAEHLYVAENRTSSDSKTYFSLVKKSKQNGQVVASRLIDLSDDWNAVTNVLIEGDYVYASGYRNYNNPQWYIEKLNKNNLSLVTSYTGINGVVDMHGMVTDGTYLYLGGFEKTAGTSMYSSSLRTRIHVEKRRLTDLSLVWTYDFPLTYYWQGSSALSLVNNEVIVTANDQMDRAGWFGSAWVGQNLRFIRLGQVTGNMITTMAYGGVANLGGAHVSRDGDVFVAGSTTNRAQTAIFRLNDLLISQGGFGVKVTQTVLNSPIVRGGPIQLRIDIENDQDASEAAWAFGYVNNVPNSIMGVVWDCVVANTGIPTGDMRAFPARCGLEDTGTGNTISFSHSSNADPLIHPGGRLSILVSGVIAPNAPPLIENTASVVSYPGWEENHFYTVNFMSSPTNYTTLVDDDITNNTSTATIYVEDEAPGPELSPTSANTPTPTLTPTPPIPFIPSCVDQSQILRTTIQNKEQYYCEDNDPTGHNLIMIMDGVIEKLNSPTTVVEDVRFVHQPSVNGQELVTIQFVVKMRSAAGIGVQSQRARNYSMTVRLR